MSGHIRRWGLATLFVLAIGGAAAAVDVTLGAIHDSDGNQRWRDVVTNPYAATKDYSYEQAVVTFTYDASGSAWQGRVAATNLKPNFAYEIKLMGKPATGPWAGADNWSNEQLGYNGRWWVDEYDKISGAWMSGRNSTDSEYNRWKKRKFTDGSSVFVFQGYLIFDFIMTDAEGKATQDFVLDSSLHVLWKTSVRAPTANDSQPRTYTVNALANPDGWYSQNYTPTDESIYGEWEPGRPLPGKLVMPKGNYNIRVLLTEESFHETAPDSGYWAGVLANDSVSFSVNVQPPPPPTGATITSVTAIGAKVGGQYNITAALQADAATTVSLDCKVSGSKQQSLQRKTLTIPAGGATVTWTDAVSPSMKAGTYTATVTVVGTSQSKTSDTPFSVTK